MTYKAFKQMIEDQASLDACDCAAFSREVATRQGGGDPDMAVAFVASVPPRPVAVITEAPCDNYVAF